MSSHVVLMIAVLGACAPDVNRPHPRPPPAEIVETGDGIGFWNGDQEFGPDGFAVYEEMSGAGRAKCTTRSGRLVCPTRAFIDEQLRVPAPPGPATGTCETEVSAPCSAQPADDTLANCVDVLLGSRRLGRVVGAEVELTAHAAKLVAESALSNELEDVAIESSRDRTALATAAFAASARDDSRRKEAVAWCGTISSELAGAAAPARLSSAMTCLAHEVTMDVETGLYARWPGCACGERGRVLGGVCVEGRSTRRPFADAPVDTRLPDALAEAAMRASRAFEAHGWTLTGIGLLGCHIVRFERGGNMQTLAERPAPRLRASDVSGHSAGAACDLTNVWLRTADGTELGYSVEMAFWALADPSGERHIAEKRTLIGELAHRVTAAGGEGAFYRALAATSPALDRGPAASYAFAVLRNALVDAGFVVYTPATNAAHYNHLHFHLPSSAAIWREVSDDVTTTERREVIVEAALVRARR